MLNAFSQVFRVPELRKKLLFTLGILVLFRLGTTIPTPNVNMVNIRSCASIAESGDMGSVYQLINLFSGGGLLNLTIFALGIMPYITSSIILQLLTVVIPRLEALKKEGSTGQQTITKYTRWLTIVLGVLQATSFTMLAVSGNMFKGCSLEVVYSKSIFVIVVMILTMMAGTSIIMWFGELITDRGVGNGMSILIFTQIVAQFPSSMWGIKETNPGASGWFMFFMVMAVGLLVMAAVIFVERAQRRIPVQYAKRMVGKRLLGGTTTYIPLKVNQSGVIPIIFASSILYLPVLYAMFRSETPAGQWIMQNLSGQTHSWIYNIAFFTLIIFFCYFYVSITFNPVEISDNMKKYGGFIPGVRAGKATEDYLGYVLSRLTAPGSIYLGIIALIPMLAIAIVGASGKFPFGGTSLLIMVGVGLDTVRQIESQLHQRNYEGFLK
ncbi:MAG: preprotein translocase subunit SecY [Propionibacteriaceae bacterium]|nr:preprotein translocase subunit SecY [Propionibacteriaceae bacterium]